jgi:hypothetical protein
MKPSHIPGQFTTGPRGSRVFPQGAAAVFSQVAASPPQRVRDWMMADADVP